MSKRIDGQRQRVAATEERIAASRERLAHLTARGVALSAECDEWISSQLVASHAQMQAWAASFAPADNAGWDEARWEGWATGSVAPADRGMVRVGEFFEAIDGTRLHLAASVPLVGSAGAIVIRSAGEQQAEQARSLLQSLVIRIALKFPNMARFHLLDPAGAGKAFPMGRFLPHAERTGRDAHRDLEVVNTQVERIIDDLLDAANPTFHGLPEEQIAAEGFRFVFAADFPKRYDGRAIDELELLAANGPSAGVYTIVHHNTDQPLRTGQAAELLGGASTTIDIAQPALVEQHNVSMRVRYDAAPDDAIGNRLLTELKGLAPKVSTDVAWDEIAGLPPDSWWQESAAAAITTPFARAGSGAETLHMTFGRPREGTEIAHGAIGATAGSGKSTLFHAIILGLAVRYSPDELRFHLIDGKFGVEFSLYQSLPHADVVSLKTAPEMARSVLRDLLDEMSHRYQVFQDHNCQSLAAYRTAGGSESFPRILCLVDEYQQFFENDREGEGSVLLQQLSAQGRAAGIHMVLASQRFEVSGMLHRAAIFGNIHLLVAMQMKAEDVRALADFGPDGRQLVEQTCTAPGRIVMNEHGANRAGRAALLGSDRRDELLAQLRQRADSAGDHRRPVVFSGQDPPTLAASPVVAALYPKPGWPDAGELESLARAPVRHGGLGIEDWSEGEEPLVLLLGQEFNVRGWAESMLRRRTSENVLVIGNHSPSRVGLMAAAAAAMALAHPPERLSFVVVDRSLAQADWSGVLTDRLGATLTAGGHRAEIVTGAAEAADAIERLAVEVERRRSLGEDERAAEPALVLVGHDLDRLEALCRVPDDYGARDSELGARLVQVLGDGPGVGVHTLVGFSAVATAGAVMSEQTITRSFRHRVAMQMSEDDSFTLLRSSAASKLQPDGPKPVAAIYLDQQVQHQVRFKPFSTEAAGSGVAIPGALDWLAQVLAHRASRVGTGVSDG